MMNKTTYVMRCGCRISRGDLITAPSQTGYKCPHHPDQGIGHLERHCIDCGGKMILTPKQSTKERCDKCRSVHVRKIKNGLNKKYRKDCRRRGAKYEPDKKQMASEAAWDCTHRLECLSTASTKSCLPCAKCSRYVSLRDVVAA